MSLIKLIYKVPKPSCSSSLRFRANLELPPSVVPTIEAHKKNNKYGTNSIANKVPAPYNCIHARENSLIFISSRKNSLPNVFKNSDNDEKSICKFSLRSEARLNSSHTS